MRARRLQLAQTQTWDAVAGQALGFINDALNDEERLLTERERTRWWVIPIQLSPDFTGMFVSSAMKAMISTTV